MFSTLTILSLNQGNIYAPPRGYHDEQTADAGVVESGSRRRKHLRRDIATNLLGFLSRLLRPALHPAHH